MENIIMQSTFLPYQDDSVSEHSSSKAAGKRAFRLQKLLVPVDFSPASINAVQYAVRLAQPFKASVCLMHAYMPTMVEPYMAVNMQEALLRQQEGIALTYFEDLSAEIPAEILSNIQLSYSIKMGPTTEEILETGKEINADHIVMGMHGSSSLGKKILGSVTMRVVQSAHCPVLIIPHDVTYKPIKNIGYATNFEAEDPRIIDNLIDMAKVYHASLHCVHVRQHGKQIDEYKQDILQKAYAYDAKLRHIDFDLIDYPKLIEGLTNYIQSQEIDVLAMLTHKRGVFGHLFHPSQTKKMAIQTPIPLWAYQIS